jgi:outer membrane protein assembly factor BamA
MIKIYKSSYLLTFCITLLLVLLLEGVALAQSAGDSVSPCPVKAVPDFFKKEDSTTAAKPPKKNFLILIPVIGSQPATGFSFGAITQYTFKGDKPEDKYSTISVGATYTTKNQLLINAKNNVLLKGNKIFLSGDWRLYIFSQPNYGLSSNIVSPRSNENFHLDSLAQGMDYNYIKFHQTASWKLRGNFYVGAGIHFDGYSAIEDEKLDTANGKFTYHYEYSKKYGFDPKAYSVNGVSLNLVYDSRDNQINANHGSFANINFRINPSLGKNQYASTVLYAEYRYFKPLSKKNVQHVLGVWAYGQFVTSGRVPYLNLPALGWDQRSRAGKGYTQGLFRGFNMVYLETEYRFPITCNQLISGTVFADFTTASDKDQNVHLFSYIQPAVGVGLRILIDKATRTNLIFNWAWGRHSKAFYLNAGESF